MKRDHSRELETVNCPYCNESRSFPWANENGFTAVKCASCGIVYVNPRPIASVIRAAVRTGVHDEWGHAGKAIEHRMASKVFRYKNILAYMFDDVWESSRSVIWLDVGAGYGELIEAVGSLAAPGSRIEGIEPMIPKVVHARARGLAIREAFLGDVQDRYDFVSLINIFSHIADFRMFLSDVKRILSEKGELLIETGTAGDLESSHDVPTELDLPNHLVFAGEKHIMGYLSEAGFSIVRIKRMRRDGLINFVKNVVKRMIGRKVSLRVPYTSLHRSIIVRARLKSAETMGQK